MRRVSPADVATGILALCAVIVTGLLIRRELRPPVAQAAPLIRDVRDWQSYGKDGQRMGISRSPVTIVEFADFQCPFCRQSARVVGALMDSLPGQVAHVFRHYPLTTAHPHAMLAAVASECAARQGQFRAYHDQLFAEQDSIGKRSWVAIAADAGLKDTVAFSGCMRDSTAAMARVKTDIDAATALGVSGTPALLVNGRLFAGAPTAEQLRSLVDKALRE
jgi:protein-disulfide isomerase